MESIYFFHSSSFYILYVKILVTTFRMRIFFIELSSLAFASSASSVVLGLSMRFSINWASITSIHIITMPFTNNIHQPGEALFFPKNPIIKVNRDSVISGQHDKNIVRLTVCSCIRMCQCLVIGVWGWAGSIKLLYPTLSTYFTN